MARGARATEERLLEVLERRQAEAKSDPSLLARPVIVVVSSGTLREHLAATIVDRLGPSVLGVEVKIFKHLAKEVLERAGKRPAARGPLFEVLVRREAAKEEVLRASLEELEDGYGIVASTVRDLLSACFEPGGRKKLERVLTGYPDGAARARALAILGVAARTAEAMAGVGRIGDLLRDAAASLEERGPDLIPAREILVHGFSDATGRATEFIRALIRHAGARILMDEPPDPASPNRADLGASFMRRFANRLLGDESDREIQACGPSPSGPPTVRFFDASGADAEAREVAYRVRELLDGGARPESVAVVARTLQTYAVPIRRHFEALGIPFSADRNLAQAGLFPAGRKIEAAMEVLHRGKSIPVERWLDALDFGRFCERFLPASRPTNALLGDLRLALRALGVARTSDLSKLPADVIPRGKEPFLLPVRRGFKSIRPDASGEAPDDHETDREETVEVRASRRKLDGKVIENLILRANELIKFEKKWPEEADISTHVEKTGTLFKDHLCWNITKDKESARVLEKEITQALEDIRSMVPKGMALRRDEVLLLLSNELKGVGVEPLGGSGAGVQVLDVTHARGLTFDHLFLVGANRGVFPRRIQEDTLLLDDARRRLLAELPHLPLKGAGFDEERYLFADLLSAAPEVCISWQRTDEEGRALNPSPLVERLWIGTSIPRAESVPRAPASALAPPHTGGEGRPRPARDALLLAALQGHRHRFGEILPLALGESRDRFAGNDGSKEPEADAAELAQARLRVLEEQDPERRPREGLENVSPYFGIIGPGTGQADPRQGRLYITTLERMAVCPWQTFLTRILRLESVPDPMAALPGLGPMHVGIAVHRTLQALVEESIGRRALGLDESLRAGPVPMPRPDPARIENLLARSAAQVACEEGIHLTGLKRALADLARPYVMSALEIDWPEATSEMKALGAEVVGETRIFTEGGERVVFFRADRADVADTEEGPVILTDYKTGKPISNAKTSATREKHFRAKVEAGTHLQVAAYAAYRADRSAMGRYLFMKPDLEAELAEAVLDHEHDAVKKIFPGVAGTLLGAWEEGIFFPRIEGPDGKEPNACKWCDVAEACIRSDSGARRRLREIVGRAEEALRAGRDVPQDLERLVRIWLLGRKDRLAPASRAGQGEGGE